MVSPVLSLTSACSATYHFLASVPEPIRNDPLNAETLSLCLTYFTRLGIPDLPAAKPILGVIILLLAAQEGNCPAITAPLEAGANPNVGPILITRVVVNLLLVSVPKVLHIGMVSLLGVRRRCRKENAVLLLATTLWWLAAVGAGKGAEIGTNMKMSREVDGAFVRREAGRRREREFKLKALKEVLGVMVGSEDWQLPPGVGVEIVNKGGGGGQGEEEVGEF